MAPRSVAERKAARAASWEAAVKRGAVTADGAATKRGQLDGTISSYEKHVRAIPRAEAKLRKAHREFASQATIEELREALSHSVRSKATLAKQGARLLKDIGSGMLSPAGLAEEAAAGAVSKAQQRQWKTDTRPEEIASNRSAGQMKPVKRKA